MLLVKLVGECETVAEHVIAFDGARKIEVQERKCRNVRKTSLVGVKLVNSSDLAKHLTCFAIFV